MKEVSIILFGVGNVGKTLIDQFLKIRIRWANEFVISLKESAKTGRRVFQYGAVSFQFGSVLEFSREH